VNKLVYFKVLVLIVALAAVIYVITHMSPEKMSAGMEQVGLAPAGAPASSAPKAQGGANETINLCKTRVHAIVWPDGRKIQEDRSGLKARWQAFNPGPWEIGSMDVEKWLSLHCEVAATARDAVASASASADYKPFVTIEYIDGTHEALDRSADGSYRFAGQTFVSKDLDSAITDLISLANLEPSGP
jgi:hypothetical protein